MIDSDVTNWRRQLSSVTGLTGDVVTVWVILAFAYPAVIFDVATPIRYLVAVVLLFFLPGYVTIAALFPRTKGANFPMHRHDSGGVLTLRERLVLSFGINIALLPLFGMILAATSAGFDPVTLLNTIAAYLLVVGSIAMVRRLRVPEDARFSFPISDWISELRAAVGSGSRIERAFTIALLCSILIAGGAVTYAIAVPTDGQQYTDFHLVTENEDGEYVSGEYPDELVVDEPVSLAWGIQNFEQTAREYTVVVQLERVAEEDGELRRIETVELDRTSVTVENGERTVQDHTVQPTLIGDDLRLTYYLYVGDAPEDPDPESAYRQLHIWVDVQPADD